MQPSEAGASSVRKSITVCAGQDRAFRVFTTRIGAWWPKSHSIGQSPIADVVIEPWEGGRWIERAEDGSECPWGRVLVWDPSRRLVLAWQINGDWQYNPSLITEVELVFTAVGSAETRVDLEHRNLDRFGVAQPAIRAAFESPEGWSGILHSFGAAANNDGGGSDEGKAG